MKVSGAVITTGSKSLGDADMRYLSSFGATYFIKRKSNLRVDLMVRREGRRAQVYRGHVDFESAQAHLDRIIQNDDYDKKRQSRINFKASLQVIQGEKWAMRASNPVGKLRVV